MVYIHNYGVNKLERMLQNKLYTEVHTIDYQSINQSKKRKKNERQEMK